MNTIVLAMGKLSEGQTKVSTIIFLALIGIWGLLTVINWWRNRE